MILQKYPKKSSKDIQHVPHMFIRQRSQGELRLRPHRRRRGLWGDLCGIWDQLWMEIPSGKRLLNINMENPWKSNILDGKTHYTIILDGIISD